MSQVFESVVRPAPRRSAFEVRMDILRAASMGTAKPTHIMYRSNTSWVILQKNLDTLVISGFLTKLGESPRMEYAITEKGMAVLKDYGDLVVRLGGERAEVRE